MSRVVQHIWEEIRIENTEALEPVFDSGRPIRSTGDMRPWYTGRPCEVTRRSHISHCVYDSTWEAGEAFEPHHGLNTLSRPLSITPKPGMVYELSCGIETPVIGIHWLCGKHIDEPLEPVRVRLGTTRGTHALH